MTTEGTGGSEFAQLVTNHGFGNVNRYVLATIVNRNGVTNHFGEDGAGTRPGLYDVLYARFVHRLDAAEKARFHKGTLFQTSAHIYS